MTSPMIGVGGLEFSRGEREFRGGLGGVEGEGRGEGKGSWGLEEDGRKCFRLPLDCYPYFSGWRVAVEGIGTKASPTVLPYHH